MSDRARTTPDNTKLYWRLQVANVLRGEVVELGLGLGLQKESRCLCLSVCFQARCNVHISIFRLFNHKFRSSKTFSRSVFACQPAASSLLTIIK
jgi:hypothetical protein